MTALHTAQAELFGLAPVLPSGLVFEPAFITPAEEAHLMQAAAALPLHEARYKGYTARRRVHAWGGDADDDRRDARGPHGDPYRDAADDDLALRSAQRGELPPALQALRARLAAWAGVAPADFVHVMVAEYRPGTPLGWHRDAPHYEIVAGVSLAGPARLRFRPWPPEAPRREDIVALDLAPRSAYLMQGVARWGWQHSVPPVPALRYAVTMRTARAGRG